MKKLAKMLFISVQGEGEDQYLQATDKEVDAIEDDGPTVVGIYKLVEKRTLVKGVQVLKKSK